MPRNSWLIRGVISSGVRRSRNSTAAPFLKVLPCAVPVTIFVHLPLIPGSVSGFVGNGHDQDPAATVQFGAGGFVGSSGGGQDHDVPALVQPVAGGVFGSTTGQDHMFPSATQFGAGIFVGSSITGHTQAPSEAVQPLPGDGPIGRVRRFAVQPQSDGSISMANQPEGAAPSKIRQLHGWVDALVQGLLFALTAIGSLWALDLHVYLNLVIYTEQYLALILCIGLATIFLTIKAQESEPAGIGVPWYDWLLAALTVVVTGYIVVEYPRLISEAGIVSWDKLILGAMAILLVMEATRRVIGWFLIGVAVVFILYARYSHLMPEIIEAPSTEWGAMIASSADYLRLAPHATIFPGIALMLMVLGYSLAGDGLRDVLDPTIRDRV